MLSVKILKKITILSEFLIILSNFVLMEFAHRIEELEITQGLFLWKSHRIEQC